MAFTDTKAVIDSQKTRDSVNTSEQAVMSGAHLAMLNEANHSMLNGGNNALASLLGGKATPVIQGESFVIPPAPYPEQQSAYSEKGKAAADQLIANV